MQRCFRKCELCGRQGELAPVAGSQWLSVGSPRSILAAGLSRSDVGTSPWAYSLGLRFFDIYLLSRAIGCRGGPQGPFELRSARLGGFVYRILRPHAAQEARARFLHPVRGEKTTTPRRPAGAFPFVPTTSLRSRRFGGRLRRVVLAEGCKALVLPVFYSARTFERPFG